MKKLFFPPLLESATLLNAPVKPHVEFCPYCDIDVHTGWHGRTDETGHPECYIDYHMTDDELLEMVLS